MAGTSGSAAKSRPTFVIGPVASSVTSPGAPRIVRRRNSTAVPTGKSRWRSRSPNARACGAVFCRISISMASGQPAWTGTSPRPTLRQTAETISARLSGSPVAVVTPSSSQRP